MGIVFLSIYLSCASHFAFRVAALNNEPLQAVCLRDIPRQETTYSAKESLRHLVVVGQGSVAAIPIGGAEVFPREK